MTAQQQMTTMGSDEYSVFSVKGKCGVPLKHENWAKLEALSSVKASKREMKAKRVKLSKDRRMGLEDKKMSMYPTTIYERPITKKSNQPRKIVTETLLKYVE